MLCILYTIVVGVGLGGVAALAERVLPARWPRRWLWCLAVLLAIAVPAAYRGYHALPVGHAASHGAGSVPGAWPALDHVAWAAVAGYDHLIDPVWAVTSVGLVAWALAGAGRVAYVVRRARPHPAVVDGVPVTVTGALGPATVGVLRGRVVVPRWVLALPAAERRYVVRHEEEHRRARDAALLLVASLTLVLLPWNLALWWLVRRLHLAVETDCDRRVVRALGDARAYGTLLLRVAERGGGGPRLQPAFLGRAGMLERRLTALLRAPARGGAGRVLAPLLAAALLAGVLALPHPVLVGP